MHLLFLTHFIHSFIDAINIPPSSTVARAKAAFLRASDNNNYDSIIDFTFHGEKLNDKRPLLSYDIRNGKRSFNQLLLITHKSYHVVNVPNLFHSFIILFIIFFMIFHYVCCHSFFINQYSIIVIFGYNNTYLLPCSSLTIPNINTWPQAMFCIVSSTTLVKVRSTVVPITTLPSTVNLHKNLDVVNHHPHPHVPNGTTTTTTGKFKSNNCLLLSLKTLSNTTLSNTSTFFNTSITLFL